MTNSGFTLVEVNGPTAICNWIGNYTQAGRLESATGTVQCESDPARRGAHRGAPR